MPIELRGDRKERLLNALVEGLPKINTSHGMFIDRKSGIFVAVCDLVLPREGTLHERLVDYLDDFPFTSFVLDTIGWELWELDQYQREVASVGLCEIKPYQDANAVAKRLVDSFLTLPWKYTVSFLLPEQLSNLLGPTVNELVLSPTVKLARATDQFAATFPLTTTNEKRQQDIKGATGLLSLLSADAPKHKSDRIYLQVGAEGFIGQYGGSGTVLRAERTLRAFCGLGIALRLFKHQHRLLNTQKSIFYAHKQNDDESWSPEYRLEVEDTTERGLIGLSLHDLDGQLQNEESKLKWGELRLKDMAAVFSAQEELVPVV